MLTLTNQLDRIEERLPSIPARIMRLQRTVAGATYDQFNEAMQTVVGASRTVIDTARISGRTVSGQTRAAGTEVLATAKRNANQVVGQTRAQSRRLATTARRETTDVIDAAIDAVDTADVADVADAVDSTPGSGRPYEQWTKAELVERADQLGVTGRTGLNKRRLIAALRKS